MTSNSLLRHPNHPNNLNVGEQFNYCGSSSIFSLVKSGRPASFVLNVTLLKLLFKTLCRQQIWSGHRCRSTQKDTIDIKQRLTHLRLALCNISLAPASSTMSIATVLFVQPMLQCDHSHCSHTIKQS